MIMVKVELNSEELMIILAWSRIVERSHDGLGDLNKALQEKLEAL